MPSSRPLIEVLLAACVALSSASLAQSTQPIRFSLERQGNDSSRIHATFRREGRRQGDNQWSSGFMPSELIGLEVSSFHAAGTRPIHFAIVREAGRLDCSGSGGGGSAAGSCRFEADPGFSQLLVRTGSGQPTSDQSFGLMALNVRSELISSIARAHYAAPRINELMALAALHVDGHYVAEMAQVGNRPQSIQKLVEFKALGITPAWIGGFARIGYANLPSESLAQLRALGITPDFVEGFRRIGYPDLPVSTLVQFKALDITPEFVRSVGRAGEPMPPVNKLAELRMFARRR